MKEATGELSMTAIVVVAIVAVGGLFTAFVWPSLKGALQNKTNCATAFGCTTCTNKKMTCTGYTDGNGNQITNGNLVCSCDGM